MSDIDASVVARADALMQRRRISPVHPPANNDLPILTEAILETDDDLPVLTAVDSSWQEQVKAPIVPEAPRLKERLVEELVCLVRARMAAELPGLMQSAVQNALAELSRELESGLIKAVEAAARDYLAQRGDQERP